MSELRDAVLARASKPSRAVAKVVAVRIKGETHEKLMKEAADAGVKPSDLVRSLIETFVDNQ